MNPVTMVLSHGSTYIVAILTGLVWVKCPLIIHSAVIRVPESHSRQVFVVGKIVLRERRLVETEVVTRVVFTVTQGWKEECGIMCKDVLKTYIVED